MIEKLPFGRTGHESTRLLLGAAAFGWVSQEEADRAMEVVLSSGINHIDTAASYGEAELRLGPWIERYRDRFFLATKTGDRGYLEARDSIQRSLERMRTHQLDLIQLHGVLEDEELEAVFAPDGALKAAAEAREKGLVRFIGITSHTLHAPVIHMRALDRFDFDSVLLPYNYMLMKNPQYAADFEALMKVCKEKNVAVQLIKTNQRRPYGDRPHSFATWYQPFNTQPEVNLAVQWALSRPGVFLNTSGDVNILPMFISAAESYRGRPSDEMMDEMLRAQEAEPLWS